MRPASRVDLDVDVGDGRLDGAIDAAGYRIVQESLTNVIRHSGARRAAVTARVHDGRLELVISDDGHGRSADATASTGSGLVGMQERTTMLGGQFCAGNGNRGFVVRAVLPARLDR